MKIKATVVSCQHETKHGVDNYTRLVKKNENPDDIIEMIKNECDFNENSRNEYFDSDIEEIVIDTDDFEIIEN